MNPSNKWTPGPRSPKGYTRAAAENVDFCTEKSQVEQKLKAQKTSFENKKVGLQENILIQNVSDFDHKFFTQLTFKNNKLNGYVMITEQKMALPELNLTIESVLKLWTAQLGLPSKVIEQKLTEDWIKEQSKKGAEIGFAEWNQPKKFLAKLIVIPHEGGYLLSMSLAQL